MSHQNWQPSTNKSMLEARAALLGEIRQFFHDRHVLEVETPVLSASTGTDPALDPIRALVSTTKNHEDTFFLQTSPEFAMKRLLAVGSGAIYQLAKSFRNAEEGKKHNPEFTLLEWYRPGFSLAELMDEVEQLVNQILAFGKIERLTYSELFLCHLALDPLSIPLESLQQVARENLDVTMVSDNPDHWLDLLFTHCIEPKLQAPVFITQYPPSQAALAALAKNDQGRPVALRFELVVNGMELANGYHELTDAKEQRQRFQSDLAMRKEAGLPNYPVDEHLLAALDHGMPECTGVALGVDRLLMLKTDRRDIREVISFPVDKV